MIAIFLLTILIVLICVLLYLFTYLIFELKSKNDNLKKISQCPDCNIKCPVVKGCEPCETCPNNKPITSSQLKQAIISHLANELTTNVTQSLRGKKPEEFKTSMDNLTSHIVMLMNLAKEKPEDFKAIIQPMMLNLADGLTAKFAQKNPEAFKTQMDAMVPLIADELIAKLAKQNPETFKAQMDAITSQLLEEMNFVKQNPEVFKTRIEIILTHLLGGIEQKKPHSRQSAPTRTAFKKHIDSASSDSDDLTPINFDDILNDLPVDDDLTPINFDDIQFDDDLPERRFDVGRDKENAIQKAKQYLTTPAPAENIIAEQFILKENFISKWTPVGKEPTILLPTIKPFQSLKD